MKTLSIAHVGARFANQGAAKSFRRLLRSAEVNKELVQEWEKAYNRRMYCLKPNTREETRKDILQKEAHTYDQLTAALDVIGDTAARVISVQTTGENTKRQSAALGGGGLGN